MSRYNEKLVNARLRRLEDDVLSALADKDSIILHILALSRIEAREAAAALLECDPHDFKQVQALQNVVTRHSDLIRWIAGTLQSGREAWKLLKQEEQGDIIDAIENNNGDDDDMFDAP